MEKKTPAMRKILGHFLPERREQRREELELGLWGPEWFRECGRLGGLARAERLSPRQRREIARKAAQARWDRSGRS